MLTITGWSKHDSRRTDAKKAPPIGTWDLDIVNNRLNWSDAIYGIFGIPKENFTPCYETFYNTIHPDDRVAWSAHRDLVLKECAPMDMEHRIVLPSGEIRHVHEQGARRVDGHGRLISLRGTVEDITELRGRGEQLQNFFPTGKQTSSPAVVIDMNGKITWVNEPFVRTFGYQLREVAGQKAGTCLQGPESNLGTLSYLRSQIEKKEAFEVELLSYSKSGQKYWMLVQGRPVFDKNGNYSKYFTIQHHLTERKLSEKG